MSETPAVTPPPKDPMKGFRGVLSGTLIMEAITVALALPVVNKLGGGITTATGWTVIGIAVALLVLCGLLKHPWAVPVVLVLQVALIALAFVLPAIAILGAIFLAAFLWFLHLRRDVARRMAAGTLPSQQQQQR
ncbi:DUF4233 domain-containing protein [Amycolatopsis sp. FDAARGOS 1241]|uniref:DUF4233 domain-containing protein n=1 Tax=Amycolatopsis sp. FDAARGOS 1241 TaxID=2778070 RepID=UPI001950F1E2|nr:DUF4233 domain-containing protein [Amycolatopsis sp. FDAARGOS 1241]QRP48315.1 DUF4233 domain-containing protein [Amycolatopsis sp. FDAARGOS 1241]